MRPSGTPLPPTFVGLICIYIYIYMLYICLYIHNMFLKSCVMPYRLQGNVTEWLQAAPFRIHCGGCPALRQALPRWESLGDVGPCGAAGWDLWGALYTGKFDKYEFLLRLALCYDRDTKLTETRSGPMLKHKKWPRNGKTSGGQMPIKEAGANGPGPKISWPRNWHQFLGSGPGLGALLLLLSFCLR